MVDNNEELSMEDILSSIKNILTEDEQANQTVSTAPETPDEPTEAVSLPDETDDVLDLSPSMMVTENIDLVAELSDVPSDVTPTSVEDMVNDTENVSLPASESLDDSDPFDFLGGSALPDIDRDILAPESEVVPSVDEVAEPEKEVETTPVAEQEDAPLFEPETYIAPEPVQVQNTEPEPEPEVASVEEPIVVEVVAPVEVEPEPVSVVEEQPQTQFSAPEPETAAPQASEEDVEAQEKDATDVSASIISNFAKMFSRENKGEAVSEPIEQISALGNGGKTIEGVVVDVIRSIIGNEVSENWRKGADYDRFAREETIRQTAEWLDKNLPAIVEKAVKAEIERVMEKVGS